MIADALSHISIKDLFNVYEENHVFQTEIAPFKHHNTKSKQKIYRIRSANPILAMEQISQNDMSQSHLQSQTNKQSQIDSIPYANQQINQIHACELQIAK